MAVCVTSIIAAAFTAGMLIFDFWNLRTDRMVPHLFLGGLVTALFYGLCRYGYELLNWGFIGIFPVVVLISYLSSLMYKSMSGSSTIAQDTDVAYTQPCTTCGVRQQPSCGEPQCN